MYVGIKVGIIYELQFCAKTRMLVCLPTHGCYEEN
jgi:hypothetical protein